MEFICNEALHSSDSDFSAISYQSVHSDDSIYDFLDDSSSESSENDNDSKRCRNTRRKSNRNVRR